MLAVPLTGLRHQQSHQTGLQSSKVTSTTKKHPSPFSGKRFSDGFNPWNPANAPITSPDLWPFMLMLWAGVILCDLQKQTTQENRGVRCCDESAECAFLTSTNTHTPHWFTLPHSQSFVNVCEEATGGKMDQIWVYKLPPPPPPPPPPPQTWQWLFRRSAALQGCLKVDVQH